ncbi:MAG: resolvase [Denitrovibrio sp.]|nr:MAG: resolvase [Denitrovibrio sp.]
MQRYVAYYRVSTAKQGQSGLGLEAQKKAVTDHLNGGEWELVAEYTEVESGKNSDRPELKEAIRMCRLTGSKLLVAKFDRLSRNLHFITGLMESKVPFTACDMPEATELTIHIMASMAQYEAKMISQRTKTSLEAAKERGVKLGTHREGAHQFNKDHAVEGSKVSVEVRQAKANEYAKEIYTYIEPLQSEGLSLNAIARKLNTTALKTPRGKQGKWTPTTVKNILKRLEPKTH